MSFQNEDTKSPTIPFPSFPYFEFESALRNAHHGS